MLIRLALGLALACGVALAQENHDGKVPWIKDPEAGLQKIKLEGKVGMLWFTADW